ncbi:MAG: I78 family peptidase inhibitor [Paracoccus sp. (in: a-proteobacteria)]|nr:I78 family peptidase inhibitor [Paracoccus sp. (in: a-proteobacteria)]
MSVLRMTSLGVLAAPFILAACEPLPPETVVIVPEPTAVCIADNYQDLVGQRSPAISLPHGTVYRQYRTGEPVTMDHNPARLNFEYDRTGTLVRVSCG